MAAEKKLRSIDPEFLSTVTIAKKVDRSSETIRKEIAAGLLKAFRFNGDYMVRVEDYEEWKARRFKPVD